MVKELNLKIQFEGEDIKLNIESTGLETHEIIGLLHLAINQKTKMLGDQGFTLQQKKD